MGVDLFVVDVRIDCVLLHDILFRPTHASRPPALSQHTVVVLFSSSASSASSACSNARDRSARESYHAAVDSCDVMSRVRNLVLHMESTFSQQACLRAQARGGRCIRGFGETPNVLPLANVADV